MLVEWRSYDAAKTRPAQLKAIDQAKRVAHDLRAQEKPAGLRTLDCVGLVQNKESRRFGLLFKMPPRRRRKEQTGHAAVVPLPGTSGRPACRLAHPG